MSSKLKQLSMKILFFSLQLNCILCQWLQSRQESVKVSDVISVIQGISVTSCQLKCGITARCNAVALREKPTLGKEIECFLLETNENPAAANQAEKSLTLYVIRKIPSPCSAKPASENKSLDVAISHSVCSKRNEEKAPGMSKDTAIPSCKWLKENHPNSRNGYYWTYHWSFTRIYCDMETDGGGWVQFANYTVQNKTIHFENALETSPSALSKMENGSNVALSSNALKELKGAFNATQFRVFCQKDAIGRTVHVMSTKNATGMTVLPFFSSESNVRPKACGSFNALPDDTSLIKNDCNQWSADGRWSKSDFAKRKRIYDYTMYTYRNLHVSLSGKNNLCDDKILNRYKGVWKFFIR